jgi:hypothetical protein
VVQNGSVNPPSLEGPSIGRELDGRKFIGGIAVPLHGAPGWFYYHAPNPLGRLTLYESGFRLGPSAEWLSGLVASWEASYDDTDPVQVVGKVPLLLRGVRFRRTSDGQCALFFSSQRREVIDALARKDLTILEAPERFNPFRPFPRPPLE